MNKDEIKESLKNEMLERHTNSPGVAVFAAINRANVLIDLGVEIEQVRRYADHIVKFVDYVYLGGLRRGQSIAAPALCVIPKA